VAVTPSRSCCFRPDAHHEEFVHIAVEDGQKFGVPQRVFGLRLVQYAAVEFDVISSRLM
jgi:hypothetical protein